MLTKEQRETIDLILKDPPEKVTFFKSEIPGELGCEIVEDGATTVGFFGENGNLIGDWS